LAGYTIGMRESEFSEGTARCLRPQQRKKQAVGQNDTDKQYLEPIATKIIQRARDEQAAVPSLTDIDSLGKNLKHVFDTGKGVIVAELRDGRR
jgi:hypothetical protein